MKVNNKRIDRFSCACITYNARICMCVYGDKDSEDENNSGGDRDSECGKMMFNINEGAMKVKFKKRAR